MVVFVLIRAIGYEFFSGQFVLNLRVFGGKRFGAKVLKCFEIIVKIFLVFDGCVM